MGVGSVLEKVKDIIGVEGTVKEVFVPALNFTSANITLGGAGYPIGQFHQQFLAYVEGLNTEQAGRISLINGLWDAFNDPVMGSITDRTHSRYGRHRPYLILSAIPFALAYIFKWTSFGISGTGNLSAVWWWYLFAAVMYSTSYTVAAIPHEAMLPQVAPTYFLRTQFKIVEYMMNSVGQVSSWVFTALAISGFNVKVALTGLPNPTPADRGRYAMVGIILSVWFLWPLIFCFFKTSEPPSLSQPHEPLNWRYLLHEYKLVFSNRSFRQYFIIQLFYSLCHSFYGITDQYFIISVADLYKYFNLFNIIAGTSEFMGSPLNYLLVRYKGKAFCGKLLGPFMVLGLALNSLVSHKRAPVFNTVIMITSAIFYNFGFSGPGFVADNIRPDVTDADELITGRRREGVIATFYSLFRKTIGSFISYAVGLGLKLFGYDPNKQAPSEQTARSTFGLRLNFVFIPTVLALFCVLSIYRYSMTKQDHELMLELIRDRREKGRAQVTDEQRERIEKITGVKWENMWIGQTEQIDAPQAAHTEE